MAIMYLVTRYIWVRSE